MKMLAQLLQNIDEFKTKLDSIRPIPPVSLKSLYEDLALRLTYHSNAIEGNTLTLMETRLIIFDGLTVGGKRMREHFEAINHYQAVEHIESFVHHETHLTEWEIKNIHALVLKNIDDDNAGRYRNLNVRITGARHEPPDFLQVPAQMYDLMQWYTTEARSLHPVLRAAELHSRFVGIHPFVDGNGRTGRLIMNLDLLAAGFPFAIIPVERRLAYYEALDAAQVDQHPEPFYTLVAEVVLAGFAPYFRLMGIKP
jgi:Fic family protein